MKPINSKTGGCNPISSNCVIWQGPDIECINLCKGDTVSDVVYSLAEELCVILDTTSVSSYDLSCLNLQNCDPATFTELIQLIINKLCEIDGIADTTRTTGSSGCPDCVISISPCFQYTNEFGDLVTTMQLTDYARTIGNKVCSIVQEITNINQVLGDHETRIVTLENEPDPTLTLPMIVPSCTSTAIPTDMAIVLANVEEAFCQLRFATGLPTEIYDSITFQCVNLNSSPTLSNAGSSMSSLPGWVTNVSNLSQNIKNMWITICDIRSAVRNIQLTCCPTGCDGIELNMYATFDGTYITIYFTGTIPSGFLDCDSSGNLITIADTDGNMITQRINITSNINSVPGTQINVSSSALNLGTDFNIRTDACLNNASTGAECVFCIEYFLDNTSNCPTITLSTTTDTQIDYSFYAAFAGTYTVQLWNAAGTLVISQNVTAVAAAMTVNGSFTGLTASTSYLIRLSMVVGANTTDCQFVPVSTNPVVCTAPTGVTGVVTLPVECENCGDAIDFVSNIDPLEDGWYVDDTSQFLILATGGVINDFITEIGTGIANNGAAGTSTFEYSIIYAEGKVFANCPNVAGLNLVEHVEVWSNGVLIDTILGIGVRASVYNENDGLLYCMYIDAGQVKIKTINPVTHFVGPDLGYARGGAALPGNLVINPVTHNLYWTDNFNRLIIVDITTTPGTATETFIGINTALGLDASFAIGSNNMSFTKTGELWIVTNITDVYTTGVTGTIAVINSDPITPTALAEFNPTFAQLGGGDTLKVNIAGATGRSQGMVYYPGTSTPGSDKMFIIYTYVNVSTTGFFDYLIFEIDTTAYTSTLFLTDATALPFGKTNNITYSTVFNKIIYNSGNVMKAYTPYLPLTIYANILTSSSGIYLPVDDVVNSTLVYQAQAITPLANLYFYSFDSVNAIFCDTGLVKLWLGNAGPYVWDNVDLEWDPIAIITVADGGANFTTSVLFDSTVVSGILIYSIDGGLTWTSLGSFETAANWATGIVFVKADIPSGNFRLAVSFLTDDSCGFRSSIDDTYI